MRTYRRSRWASAMDLPTRSNSLVRFAAANLIILGMLPTVLCAGPPSPAAAQPAEPELWSRIEFPAASLLTGPRISAAGIVLDPSGTPVPGVTVLLREWSTLRFSENPFDRRPRDVFARRVTDAEGRFRFDGVPSPISNSYLEYRSRWDVVAAAPGRAITWEHILKPASGTELPLTLRPEATLSGRLVDEAGRPIPDAEIELYGIASLDAAIGGGQDEPGRLDLQASRLSPRTTSDAEGRFTLRHLPADARVMLSIKHDDFEWEAILAATTDQVQPDVEYSSRDLEGKRIVLARKVHNDGFDYTLRPGYRVEGQVLYGDSDRPVPHADVGVNWNAKWRYTRGDEQGRFSITGLPFADVEYVVHARPSLDSGLLPFEAPTRFADGARRAEVELRLPRGESITGHVIASDTKKGIPRVTVVYEPADTESASCRIAGCGAKHEDNVLLTRAMTDENGRFRMTVPAGEGTLRIFGPQTMHMLTVLRTNGDSESSGPFVLRSGQTHVVPDISFR